MGSDMVVALGPATVDGQTLFGHNSDRPLRERQSIRRVPGREFAPGEKVRTNNLELSQARQTYTVLGAQPEGCWGFTQGVNDQGVAAGCAALHNKIPCSGPGLLGTDLTRLILERSHTARQAVDSLIDLVGQYGQSEPLGNPRQGDSSFLITDATEAFAVETAGPHWVYQEIREVRAAGNACIIRQDWNRISPGLSDYVIRQGWWPADGSKLDFAGAVTENPMGHASGLRRWGRATLLLEQQNGHIDSAFLRRVLADHYEGTHFEVDPLASLTGPVTLCQHGIVIGTCQTATSMVAQLGGGASRLNMVWCAFGPPCSNVYFPLFLEGEIPEIFGGETPSAESLWTRSVQLSQQLHEDPEQGGLARETFGRLQARLDEDAEEFAEEGAALKRSGALTELQRLAGLRMQHSVELFESAHASLQKTAETHSVLA
jgi:dipeptidase